MFRIWRYDLEIRQRSDCEDGVAGTTAAMLSAGGRCDAERALDRSATFAEIRGRENQVIHLIQVPELARSAWGGSVACRVSPDRIAADRIALRPRALGESLQCRPIVAIEPRVARPLRP